MNTHAVTVDEENLRASFEADAAQDPRAAPGSAAPGSAAPGAAPGGSSGEPVADPNAWMQEARLLASFLAHKITPGWEVPDDVQEQWAGALSACLGKLMPGGAGNIEGWGPWGKLLYASAAWGMAGIDLQNFRMKPLQPRDPREPIEGQATRAEGAATSGGFTTGR